MASSSPSPTPPTKPRSRLPLFAIVAISLAPLVLAALAYFLPDSPLRPKNATNYGSLIDPQRPVPAPDALGLATLDGKPFDLRDLAGKWLLLAADSGHCTDSCANKLLILRNSHASLGKNVERVKRVWFILDDEPIPEKVMTAYQGTVMLRVSPEKLAAYLAPQLPADADPQQRLHALQDPMWIIDPISNLMLQFPADADPLRVRKDISRLLFNSRIG